MARPGVHVELEELLLLEHQARGFSFRPRQPVHSLLSGRHASKVRGRGLDFEELKSYLPGDDVRAIDWRVTARTHKPYVRVYTEERDRSALFVVDQRVNMFFGSRRCLKSVAAAETAALGLWRVLAGGDRVGALVFDDQDVVEVRPQRSRRAALQVLHAITAKNQALRADAEVEPNPAMLDRVLHQAARLAKHDTLVVVISDFDGVTERTRSVLGRIGLNNDVIVATVQDPLATAIPDVRNLVVSDGALQVELPTGEGGTRRRLEHVADERMQPVLAWQRELGIPVLLISTAEPVVEQIRRLLGFVPTRRRG